MAEKDKINVGIFGGTGYTGGDICRLLLNHKNVENILPSSRGEEGFDRIHTNLFDSGLEFVDPEELESMAKTGRIDVAFLCLPSGESMKLAPKLLEEGTKVIDLGPDFRSKSASLYEKVYGRKHTCPELLEEAAYGITEFNRGEIRQARLVANPGCYVIATMLGLAPLLDKDLIELQNVPVNAINGTTGASSKPLTAVMHYGVFGNILSYSMEGHRHSSELEEQIKIMGGGEDKKKVLVNFNAAHGNFTRGVHAVISPLIRKERRGDIDRDDLLELFNQYYKNEFFVRVIDFKRKTSGTTKEYDLYPQIKNIRGTNFCDVGVDYDAKRGIIKVISVADNLVKGSAGSAIQNMNVMFGFDETESLRQYTAI